MLDNEVLLTSDRDGIGFDAVQAALDGRPPEARSFRNEDDMEGPRDAGASCVDAVADICEAAAA